MRKRRPKGTEKMLQMEILERLLAAGGAPVPLHDLRIALDLQPNHLWKLTTHLEAMGLVERRGRALYPTTWIQARQPDSRFHLSLRRSAPIRDALAEFVAHQIVHPDDDVLALDSGATARLTFDGIARLPGHRTVLTANVELGRSNMIGSGTKVELLGGRVDPDSRALVAGLGASPAAALATLAKSVIIDLSVVVPLATSWLDNGNLALWTQHPEEEELRRELLRVGKRTALIILPDRMRPKGRCFAEIGTYGVRTLDASVELVGTDGPPGSEGACFLKTARASKARVHIVTIKMDHSDEEKEKKAGGEDLRRHCK